MATTSAPTKATDAPTRTYHLYRNGLATGPERTELYQTEEPIDDLWTAVWVLRGKRLSKCRDYIVCSNPDERKSKQLHYRNRIGPLFDDVKNFWGYRFAHEGFTHVMYIDAVRTPLEDVGPNRPLDRDAFEDFVELSRIPFERGKGDEAAVEARVQAYEDEQAELEDTEALATVEAAAATVPPAENQENVDMSEYGVEGEEDMEDHGEDAEDGNTR